MVDFAAGPRTETPGRRTRLVVTLAGVAAVVLVAGLALLTWPRTTTVRTMTATVAYGDEGAHVAVLKHVHAPLGTDHWVVVLGRDPGGDYGHLVRLDATGVDAGSVAVQWEKDTAVLVYGSGHRVSVPSRFFTGGR